MSAAAHVPLSVLDLVPIVRGGSAAESLRNTRDLAQEAERLGYVRYWLAEHHNMAGIASSATAVIIGHVAAATSTIRVGSGGVMLPNHAPLVVAEQFGTLEALYPGRIDLGIGRAPGTDQRTARALRRDRIDAAETFPQDLLEVQSYFRPAHPGQPVRAVPGAGLHVPIWLLGSSLFSAKLAARLGLPYAFASHFAPDDLMEALAIYRREFRPSEQLAQSHAMAGVNVFAADTDAEAERLFTSVQQAFAKLVRGEPGPLEPPVDTMEGRWSAREEAFVAQAMREAVIGAPDPVRRGLQAFIDRTGVDEVIITGMMYDHAARRHSLELVAELRPSLRPAPVATSTSR
jgi:luciferase family oxidoreductase group 1